MGSNEFDDMDRLISIVVRGFNGQMDIFFLGDFHRRLHGHFWRNHSARKAKNKKAIRRQWLLLQTINDKTFVPHFFVK